MADRLELTSRSYILAIAVLGTVIVALFSLALPIHILTYQTPIGAATPAALLTLHESAQFFVRACLTFIYFPAVLVLHFLLARAPGLLAGVALLFCGLWNILPVLGNCLYLGLLSIVVVSIYVMETVARGNRRSDEKQK